MQNLFSEFPPTSAKDWKNQLIKDLKGEPYENLIWENENGFNIQPFYTSESLSQEYNPAFTHSDWEICVHKHNLNSEEVNHELLRDLNRGASSISVECKDLDFEVALENIQLNYIASSFVVNDLNAPRLKEYFDKYYPLKDLNCSLFPEKFSTIEDLNNWQKVISIFDNFNSIKPISINILPFHNQNCLAYYEIALILSALNEYLSLGKKYTSTIVIKTGVNSDYFVQIAKLRAIRRLWSVIKEEYCLTNNIHLVVETSLTNKSISDKHTNLLRTTIESMAAIAGGCNELIVTKFDALFSENDQLSSRMAINQQLILKDESYLNKMADIACGSYYIESITDALACKALDTFKRFENTGGFFKCIENEVFSREIKLQSQKRYELIKSGKEMAVGVNKYRNEKGNISFSKQKIDALNLLNINNSILKFELENFFN